MSRQTEQASWTNKTQSQYQEEEEEEKNIHERPWYSSATNYPKQAQPNPDRYCPLKNEPTIIEKKKRRK